MRAAQRFFVTPTIPPALGGLTRLASNLAWTWDHRTQELFAHLDGKVWSASDTNPVDFLHRIGPQRWSELAADADVIAAVNDRVAALDHAIARPGWFSERAGSPLQLVAYFSPEFGLSETLPQYSGGLGVLAGDHLKAASDLGIPLVGIGLLYREGYFRQRLDATGWQRERFPRLDPQSLALTDTGLRVDIPVAGEQVKAAVWRVDVGRIALYLLDTDVEGNSEAARAITDRLYGGDTEHRLRQEIVLGIGGVRALRALGLAPQVFHTNEGHAGFLTLERVRELVRAGLSFAAAVEAVRAGGLFTTHTPVPAGIDRYPHELMTTYFATYSHDLGCSFDELMELGRDGEDTGEPHFNMAALGLRMSARSNAVAALHGAVSRRMFQHLWPGAVEHETPITSVTNGVHAKTWVAPRIDSLLSSVVNPVWDGADVQTWARVRELDDGELWNARRAGRAALVAFVRERLRADVLDPDALTIGFARRFATYKRATLLLTHPERLRSMLLSSDRPVQFVFAGKAHPADEPGKQMIQAIEQFASELEVSHRFVFLQDYDMGVARAMYQGCDVWLNTPRRPFEACGTSGMKAALNGALNCSIADGWWDECADGLNGWVITSADDDPHPERRDQREALNLFNVLEGDVVPTFYDGHPPTRWIARMKHAWATLGPYVTASRMVKDYTTRLYEPAAAHSDRFATDGLRAAQDLAMWKARLASQWPAVRITSFAADEQTAEARVDLGGLDAGEVACEIVHGPVDAHGSFTSAHIEQIDLLEHDGRTARFRGKYSPVAAGSYGSTVRVRAQHALLTHPVETGLITWLD